MPPRYRWVTADDATTRLAVVEVGDPSAPAWVVAHGAGSAARFVTAAFAGPVVAAGGRLVTYDARGHGASDPARAPVDHHLDTIAGDLAAVVRSVRGTVDVVGGVSLGGHAAIRAAGAPEVTGVAPRRAVLACLPAWTGPAVAGQGPHAAIAAQVAADGIAAHLAQLRTAVGLPAWLRTTLLADQPRHDPASLAAALLALDGGVAPGEGELAALGPPVAVVGWPDDPGHPLEVAERWAGLARRGRLRTLELWALDAGVDRLGAVAVAAVAAATDAG